MSSTSTTLQEATQAILAIAAAAWAPTGYVLQFENEVFVPPPTPAVWARLSIRHQTSTQDTLGPVGSRQFERTGNIFVQIFAPQNTGTDESMRVAQILLDAFEGVRVPGTTLNFFDSIPRTVGPFGDYHQTQVQISFTYTQRK